MKFKINKQQLIQENVGKYALRGALIGGGLAAIAGATAGIETDSDFTDSRIKRLPSQIASYEDSVNSHLRQVNELTAEKARLDKSIDAMHNMSNNANKYGANIDKELIPFHNKAVLQQQVLNNNIKMQQDDAKYWADSLIKIQSPEYIEKEPIKSGSIGAGLATPFGATTGLAAGAGVGYLANRYKKR